MNNNFFKIYKGLDYIVRDLKRKEEEKRKKKRELNDRI